LSLIWMISRYFYPCYSFYFFTWHLFSNCWFYYLYMLLVFLLSLYLLFMHCYCFTYVNCIVLHSFILVSCLLYLLCHSCLCDDVSYSTISWRARVCVCILHNKHPFKTASLSTNSKQFKTRMKQLLITLVKNSYY
jgi:hypothetical protein